MEKYSADKGCVVMSRSQVRAFDSWAINELGIPAVVLMENAGRSCAELIKEKIGDSRGRRVCIFCGTGNNGGDGYVIARHLLNSGFEVVVVLCGGFDKVKGDAKINLDILKGMSRQVEVLDINDEDVRGRVESFAAGAEMIVDGIFGTGFRGCLSDGYQRLIEGINALGRPVVAVDIPSGLDCDTGQPLPTAVRATYTVTFAAVKKGFAEYAGAAEYAGEIYVASIGVAPMG